MRNVTKGGQSAFGLRSKMSWCCGLIIDNFRSSQLVHYLKSHMNVTSSDGIVMLRPELAAQALEISSMEVFSAGIFLRFRAERTGERQPACPCQPGLRRKDGCLVRFDGEMDVYPIPDGKVPPRVEDVDALAACCSRVSLYDVPKPAVPVCKQPSSFTLVDASPPPELPARRHVDHTYVNACLTGGPLDAVDEELSDPELVRLVDPKEDLALGAVEDHLPGDDGYEVCCGGLDATQPLAKTTVV